LNSVSFVNEGASSGGTDTHFTSTVAGGTELGGDTVTRGAVDRGMSRVAVKKSVKSLWSGGSRGRVTSVGATPIGAPPSGAMSVGASSLGAVSVAPLQVGALPLGSLVLPSPGLSPTGDELGQLLRRAFRPRRPFDAASLIARMAASKSASVDDGPVQVAADRSDAAGGEPIDDLDAEVESTFTPPDHVSQDALIKAWQALPTYRGEAPLRNWILRITHNTAVSALRRRREELRDPSELPERISHVSLESTVQNRVAFTRFTEALDELDETSRSIVTLRELEGCTYDEICEILDLPLPTVKTRLLRARRQLARSLEGWRP